MTGVARKAILDGLLVRLDRWAVGDGAKPKVPRDDGFRDYLLRECGRAEREYHRVLADSTAESAAFGLLKRLRDLRDAMQAPSDEGGE